MSWIDRLLGRARPNAPESVSLENLPSPTERAGLPFPVVVVHGRIALGALETLRVPGTTPVIMGAPDRLDLITDLIAEDQLGPGDFVRSATTIDPVEWCRRTIEADPECFEMNAAPWPRNGERIELSVHKDVVTRQFLREVVIGLVPTNQSWEVPAFLHYGGWNECPEPAVHVALHRLWNDQFGSELVCASSDVIQCTVRRRPASNDEAMALARQMFAYCPDVVLQGTSSLEALAAALLASDAWYFWWD